MEGLGVEDYGELVSLWATSCFKGRNIMTPVSNQRNLSCCISFALSAVLGALYALENPGCIAPDFSKQEMVDCQPITHSGTYYSLGYGYVFGRGLHREEEYPYLNVYNSSCRCFDLRGRFKISFRNYTFILNDWEVIPALRLQPLTAGIHVYDSFLQYSPLANPALGLVDVYRPYPGEQPISTTDGSPTCHAVLVIGFGIMYGEEFFIIKNWSGLSWGYNGYARVAANLLFAFGYPRNIRVRIL